MAIVLDHYQIEAIRKMKNGSILCGGVGSGKSRTGLAYYYIHEGLSLDRPEWRPNQPRDLYIITTAKKRDTHEWEEELLPFLMSIENCYHKNKVVIDSWNNIKKYKEVHGAFFIFDEDRVTGYGAWVKAFLNISRKNYWILLSATPGDTWMDYIPVFIANGFYRNKTDFTNRHVVYKPRTTFPQVERFVNTGHLNALRREILVDMDYKNKAEHHDTDIYCEFDRDLYKGVLKRLWDPFKDAPIENAAGLCYTLRKVVNSDPSRLANVLDITKNKARVIIFYNYDYELEILKNTNYGRGVRVAEWNGHKHDPIPETEKWIYLVQYAACEGWNCIKTDTIIFYSQTYSYKTLVQASGRIDRRNTPYTDLYYYHLKSRSSIDLAIGRALKNKEVFNEKRFVDG